MKIFLRYSVKAFQLLLTLGSIYFIVMQAGGVKKATIIASSLKRLGTFTGLGMTGGLFIVAMASVLVCVTTGF